MARLRKKEATQAYARFARRHGFYVSTVRHNTQLQHLAIVEWRIRPLIQKQCPAYHKGYESGFEDGRNNTVLS